MCQILVSGATWAHRSKEVDAQQLNADPDGLESKSRLAETYINHQVNFNS